jgi:hypothetical protein
MGNIWQIAVCKAFFIHHSPCLVGMINNLKLRNIRVTEHSSILRILSRQDNSLTECFKLLPWSQPSQRACQMNVSERGKPEIPGEEFSESLNVLLETSLAASNR